MTAIGEAEIEKRQQAYNLVITAAWHVDAFRRQERLPPLKRVLRLDRPKAGQKHDGMLAMRQHLEAYQMRRDGMKARAERVTHE